MAASLTKIKSLKSDIEDKGAKLIWKSLENKTGKGLWTKANAAKTQAIGSDTDEPIQDKDTQIKRRSTLKSLTRKPNLEKMKMEVDRLWESSQSLMKKEGTMMETDIERLRKIIQEAVDLSGRVRVLIREKDTYTDDDVVSHARDVNNLQLFLHNIVEIWARVESPLKEKYARSVSADMMELATDICSVFGEVMATFVQRFGLDIVPLMRPVHGLFYSISIHCRYHCPNIGEEDVTELKSLYSSFLSGLIGLMKSTKVLLKRLKFDQEIIANRRRLVQTNISLVIDAMRSMVKDGRLCSSAEYIDTIERIGSLCTDIFFVIGKTSSIVELLELGESCIAIEPTEVLGEICHSDVQRSSIEQRPVALKGLEIDDGTTFISDVFLMTGSPFNPSRKVTIRMPFSGVAIPPGAVMRVKLKIGEEWYDSDATLVGREEELNGFDDGIAKVRVKTEEDIKPKRSSKDEMLEFQTKFVQAFVAILEFPALIKDLTQAGYMYICPEDDRVRINFPEDCVSQTATLAFKLIQINRTRMLDYKEQCAKLCQSIIAVSDCLKVYHDEDVVFAKPVMIHLPIPNDIDDSESEIVIFRTRDDGEIELIPKRTAMLCPSTQNCYTFQIQSFGGIAIGKVKKKSLRKNRAAIIEEYDLYTEQAYICNALTFLDKSLLHVGIVKLFVEIVERRFVKKALRRRVKEGLFEVPGSRSQNIRIMNEDIICLEIDGNLQRVPEVPLENYFIVYLSSAKDNFRSFSVETRHDPLNRAYGILNFYKDNDDEQKLLHSAVIDANKYMLNVPDRSKTILPSRGTGITSKSLGGGSWSSRPATRSARDSIAYRAVFDDVPVLSHQSLLALATHLKTDTIQNLSYELGIPYDFVMEQKLAGLPSVIANFNIIWHWRGHKPTREKVQILISAFNICGYSNIGERIVVAGNEKRALTKEDFVK